MPPTAITIHIDANSTQPRLSTILHELIHILLYPCFAGRLAPRLEEVAILAYEAHLYTYVMASPRRRALWEAALDLKLAETPDAPAS